MSLKDPVAQWRDWWRSVGVFGPLSGDVTQTIDPTLFRAVGDQVGFINVNTSAAGDPALERRITEQVASYGRQLGRILDAVDVLLRHTDLSYLPPEDQRAVDELRELHADIEAVKLRSAADSVDRLVQRVRGLAADPKANREALDRLRAALA
jgi:hypothetical protein